MFYNKVCREAEFVGAAAVMVRSHHFARPRFSYPQLFVVPPGITEKSIRGYMIYSVGPLGEKMELFSRSSREPL